MNNKWLSEYTKLHNSIYDDLISEYKEIGNDMVWIMKDGTEIFIKNMETSHIKNCINMLKRTKKNETKLAWIDIFTDVLMKRRESKLNKILDNINDNKLFG